MLPPYRLLLLAAVPKLVIDLARGTVKVRKVDGLILMMCLWIFLSVTIVAGFGRAVNAGGALALDIGVSYFLAAWSIRSVRDVQRLLVMIAPAFFFLAALAMPLEALSGQYILQPIAAAMAGTGLQAGGFVGDADIMIRHGLLRATGPWPHPILAGMVLGSLLPFALSGGLRQWPRTLLMSSAFAAVFTISSSAILALVAQGGLLFYDKLVQRIRQLNWHMLLAGIGIFVFAAQFSTQRGVWGFLQLGAINSQTAAYRSLIWNYGSQSVRNHPLFGVAYGEWGRLAWMPNTIDNYWLNLAVQFGLPTAILGLGIPIILIISAICRMSTASTVQRRLLLASAISLGVMVLGAFSVALWVAAQVWLSVLMGILAGLERSSQTVRFTQPQRVQNGASVPLNAFPPVPAVTRS